MVIYHWLCAFFYFLAAIGCGFIVAFGNINDFQSVALTVAAVAALIACGVSAFLADKAEEAQAKAHKRDEGRFSEQPRPYRAQAPKTPHRPA